MKSFLKYTLATVCGLLIFSIVAVVIIIAIAVGSASSGSSVAEVKDNSVFVLKLDGVIDERAEEGSPMDMLLGRNDMSAMGLDDIVTSIRRAAKEDGIKGIYIEGGVASFDSPATAQQVRDALKDFKKSGKWIYAYADGYTQAAYYVASVADSLFLNRTGMIELKAWAARENS